MTLIKNEIAEKLAGTNVEYTWLKNLTPKNITAEVEELERLYNTAAHIQQPPLFSEFLRLHYYRRLKVLFTAAPHLFKVYEVNSVMREIAKMEDEVYARELKKVVERIPTPQDRKLIIPILRNFLTQKPRYKSVFSSVLTSGEKKEIINADKD